MGSQTSGMRPSSDPGTTSVWKQPGALLMEDMRRPFYVCAGKNVRPVAFLTFAFAFALAFPSTLATTTIVIVIGVLRI